MLTYIGNFVTNIIYTVAEYVVVIFNARWLMIINLSPVMVGILVQAIIILLIGAVIFLGKNTKLYLVLEAFFEKMYNFFEEVLGEQEHKWIKLTVVGFFFVVFIANLMGWLGDILAQGITAIETGFLSFSSDRSSVFALSISAVLLTLIVQLIHLGPGKFVHEYIPIRGKKFISVTKGSVPLVVYYPLRLVVKLFDIVISLFIGLLDIIGIFAKMISLAFRLYGNMIAGTILLVLLTEASIKLSASIGNIDLPIILPLILFIQGLLVATVQAFVVSLLSAIFVKVAKG
jgi:F0F1-type ATP synthase membrane subunit a